MRVSVQEVWAAAEACSAWGLGWASRRRTVEGNAALLSSQPRMVAAYGWPLAPVSVCGLRGPKWYRLLCVSTTYNVSLNHVSLGLRAYLYMYERNTLVYREPDESRAAACGQVHAGLNAPGP